MAATTAVNLTLNARDWETLVGIISNSADPNIRDIIFQLSNYYKAQATKPAGSDPIVITTTEATVVSLSAYLMGNTVFNVHSDVGGGSPFTRTMTALRAANNVTDNYISTQLAVNDTANTNSRQSVRKTGRAAIMMLQYDNA